MKGETSARRNQSFGVGEKEVLAGAGCGHIKKPAFLLEVQRLLVAGRKAVFSKADDKDRVEFFALGRMNG